MKKSVESLKNLNRRRFLKSSANILYVGTLASGAVAFSTSSLQGCRYFKKSQSRSNSVPQFSFGPFVKIAQNGIVTVVCDKAEIGQGVSSLACAIVAEELELNPQQVQYEFAPAEEVYANRRVIIPLYVVKVPVHAQITGLSSSTSDMYEKLRLAAAATKYALLLTAAKRLNIPWNTQKNIQYPAQLKLLDGRVIDSKSGRSFAFGDLALNSSAVANEVFKKFKLGSYKKQEAGLPEPKKALNFLGKNAPELPGTSGASLRVDSLAKITGKAVFGIDVQPKHTQAKSFLFAIVVRGSEIGSTVDIANLEEVLRFPKVKHVFKILNGRGIAVLAESSWHAIHAARAVKLTQKSGPNALFATFGENGLERKYENSFSDSFGSQAANVRKIPVVPAVGIEAALAEQGGSVEAKYVVPYVPHSTLEPMNCVVYLADGTWVLHAPTQFPEAALAAMAKTAGVAESRCKVVSTLAGGGFGRRLVNDFIVEGVSISKALNGQAIKLFWTREDDTKHDYFRPMAAHKMQGKVTSGSKGILRQEIITQSINSFVAADYIASILPDKIKSQKLVSLFARIGSAVLNELPLDPFSVEGALETHYSFDRRQLISSELTGASTPKIPIGYWRSVGHSHTAFAIECFIDEMCSKSAENSVDFRKRCLQKEPRALAALQRVVQISGYSPAAKIQISQNVFRAKGLACHSGWGSSIAAVADVSVDTSNGSIVLHEFWAVADCGFVVQPDIVKQQIEGGIVFGLSAAMKQEITIINGVVQQSNFHDCDILRYFECPKINVEILQQSSETPPTGVGELPVPIAAPAVANAVGNATGIRLRKMPFLPGRVLQAAGALLAVLFVVFFSTPHTFAAENSLGQENRVYTTAPRIDGKKAFQYLHSVATHPRCVNCHGTYKNGEHVPTVGNGPLLLPHPMRITSSYPSLGSDCTTCHQKQNNWLAGAPPGAANDIMKDFLWQMPPSAMMLRQNMTQKELCEIWTDSKKNAGKTGDRGGTENSETLAKMRREFMHHVADDPLVHWTFQPGPLRVPAPGSKEQLIAAMDSWIAWLEQGNRCAQLP